ncbi:anthranilate synthase component I family protein [Pseudodesulfovibrio tunisiensis]|uniref:anthranilate synthase component I family protein n=1 Tax=Pseudodesulfovibrio tunisiensis TaxID=463192 RepID=UPI001FB2D806|nr:chorismate-binding protein [Pseudodesulfovibrio tunisiensis]
MRSAFSASCDRARFDAFAGELARRMDADLLLSAPGFTGESRTLAGIGPDREFVLEPDTSRDAIKSFCFSLPGTTLGYLSYAFGMHLRGIATDKACPVPFGVLRKYRAVAEFHAVTGTGASDASGTVEISGDPETVRMAADLFSNLDSPVAPGPVRGLPDGPFRASLDRAGYETGVRETLERIRDGHTYQLNLTTRLAWDCPELDSLNLFLHMRRTHPAPFYFWFTAGQQRILSTSPERFLRVEQGEVLAQPIKGTLRFDEYSPELERTLTSDPKEDAELSMIVDLLRNDISMNCEVGTVRVEEHKSVFQVDNLLQMYANVRGSLAPGRDCLDLFLDAFPGGSITGCPKRRSMEIIEELEPHARGAYCGSAVVIEDEQTMDSSILIRTAVHDRQRGVLEYWAGSGIVVDSDPVKEYWETMAKAEKFLHPGDA